MEEGVGTRGETDEPAPGCHARPISSGLAPTLGPERLETARFSQDFPALVPMPSSSTDTTALLAVARSGDDGARNALFGHVYAELKRLAYVRLGASADATVSATGLVHEAYLKMVGAEGEWEDRRHFMRVAAGAMRHVLIDRARARRALKRGGDGRDATLKADVSVDDASADQVLEIHEALERLTERDAELGQLVELRFFGGLEVDEVADVLGVSPRTAARRWAQAKAQLRAELV